MTLRKPLVEPAHVVIAGGGFGAVESLLALRALAGEHLRLTLVSASQILAYKPAATAESFDEAQPLAYDLQAIADDVGAEFRLDRVEAVAAEAHTVRLASFAYLDYDELVLAVGARAVVAVPGALTFRDQQQSHHIRQLAGELGSGALRIVFAVPPGCSWPLPLYELALLTAARLEELHLAFSPRADASWRVRRRGWRPTAWCQPPRWRGRGSPGCRPTAGASSRPTGTATSPAYRMCTRSAT